jgi:hypothetical protein
MSDWMDIPDNPTLAIQFPWDKRPLLTCLNCNRSVSHVDAKSHAYEGWPLGQLGCGIEFKYVTTAASEKEWTDWVRNRRPDLEWKTVRWG